jgi:predicted glycogen debranching enzyme
MINPTLVFPWKAGDDPAFLRSREWLITNGMGGYASGTLLGVGTRRFHGLFIPNLPAPLGRIVVIPRFEEQVVVSGRTVQLGGAEFGDGQVVGETANFLQEYRHEQLTPVWRFMIDGYALEKRLVMPHRQNTVYAIYRLLSESSDAGPVQLHFRPYIAFRRHDIPLNDPIAEGPFPLTVFRGRYEIPLGEGLPVLKLGVRPECCVFVVDNYVSDNVLYRLERDRGYDHITRLHSPGYFSVPLNPGQEIAFVASVEPAETLDIAPHTIVDNERHRVERVLSIAPEAARTGLAAHLVLAADQFIIVPGTRPEEQMLAHTSGEHVRTVVAGYHWFTDWGRDTMISLEGLTLCTGRHYEAKAILHTFGHYVRDGLLPNQFPEGARTAIYNTVDATLWYFHALDRYCQYTGDRDTLERLFPILRSVIDYHVNGTHFGIGVDPRDGLLREGAEGFALTWMDAKVGEWVVTPRRGKPVEVQALWYNALRLMAVWAQELGQPTENYLRLAETAWNSFNQRFWFKEGSYLYDLVDGEKGNETNLRPNQVFAISLRFPIASEPYWKPVMAAVTGNLVTPFGLRTLAPGHKDYKPRYDGDLRARDAAYHQGTVWPWLIGHFLEAWLKVYGDKTRAREFLSEFDVALRAATAGSLSEIFDAEPPYSPRGCIAQAWSVAEVLRSVLALNANGEDPTKRTDSGTVPATKSN